MARRHPRRSRPPLGFPHTSRRAAAARSGSPAPRPAASARCRPSRTNSVSSRESAVRAAHRRGPPRPPAPGQCGRRTGQSDRDGRRDQHHEPVYCRCSARRTGMPVAAGPVLRVREPGEGVGETLLMLTPPRRTRKDGGRGRLAGPSGSGRGPGCQEPLRSTSTASISSARPGWRQCHQQPRSRSRAGAGSEQHAEVPDAEQGGDADQGDVADGDHPESARRARAATAAGRSAGTGQGLKPIATAACCRSSSTESKASRAARPERDGIDGQGNDDVGRVQNPGSQHGRQDDESASEGMV